MVSIEHKVNINYMVLEQLLKPLGKYKIVSLEGGTRSGKTYNAVLFLIHLARTFPGIRITVASRDVPHLRRGAMKDFVEIMIARNLWNKDYWRERTLTYLFRNGSYIEFMGADDLQKVSGPSRDILFCNEANFLKYMIFRQLQLRTTVSVIMDYNPIHPIHWIYDKVLTRPDCFLWRSTYKDNDFLSREQIEEIEMMAQLDPEWARVYVRGERGVIQKGQIYKDWEAITYEDYQRTHGKEYYGMDWGFFPDPNAVVGVKFRGNERYVRKVLYQNNMSDEDLVKTLKAYKCNEDSVFVAPIDTGGSKAIQYMRSHGFPCTYAYTAKPGSVGTGIKALRSKKVFYVHDKDLEFEYGNYTYLLDPNENVTSTPIDKYNHLLDAFRILELYKPYL